MSTPMIKISVSAADATIAKTCTLTSGMVSVPVVKFFFTDEWEGLGKVAVFMAGNVSKEKLITNNEVTVPVECLATAGVNLIIGVYGADEQIVIPTVYCSAGEILTGTSVEDADNEGTPTTSLVDQMLGYAADIEAIAETLDDLAIRTVTVNTEDANNFGIASVTLGDTGSGSNRTITFKFENLKGNGIESITWSSSGEYRGRIQITESDGTVTNFDALIEAINYLENLTNRSEAYAIGTIDGVDVPSTDDAYHNNSKYYSEQAAGSAATFETDTTLAVSGKAADSKTVGDIFDSAPAETTGEELLAEEELNTLYTEYFVDTLDRLFSNLPQDDSLEDIYDELVIENSWIDQLYREVAATID